MDLAPRAPGVDPADIPVADAMSAEVYTASVTTPLDEVLEAMANNKYGSVVVTDGPRTVGVFTVVDALRASLAGSRRAQRRQPGEEETGPGRLSTHPLH